MSFLRRKWIMKLSCFEKFGLWEEVNLEISSQPVGINIFDQFSGVS